MFNIALYQPDIPQNTAAIIRLCSCFDATLEIIEPCGFHIHDKRLKRVAMDYLDINRIITYSSYSNFLIKKKNSRIILMSTKAKRNYNTFSFKPKCFAAIENIFPLYPAPVSVTKYFFPIRLHSIAAVIAP